MSGSDVTEIVVSGNDCATGEITLATMAGYVFDEGATQSYATSVTWTLTTPVSIATFDPGTITVTLDPNP